MIKAEEYIPLVSKVTGGIYKRLSFRYSYDDLFQVGCVGLMKAIKGFDESKGYKFTTYAYKIIKGNIYCFIRDDSWYVAKRNKDRLKESYAPDSLDRMVGEKDTPIIDLIEGNISECEDFDLTIALNKLPKSLKKIILMKYFYEFTWEEISKAINVSQSSLYRHKVKAFEILRKELMS
ncbi:sigma-70 family RNA polymerase sigma factor [Clostridium scatologenes]|uniref:RNA polymerase sigma factor n=1 Tax=Clostridium scatologenes TaxID=1548 RepID=A0A0E3JZP1_CLOSL|nr:sigma-70 family RNA polymerase sigma factor [Clostridium scatologenes]AKA68502.1 RNA polymerase sigma factor [Clostridium scatologenes]